MYCIVSRSAGRAPYRVALLEPAFAEARLFESTGKSVGATKAVLIIKTTPPKALEELFICINPLTL